MKYEVHFIIDAEQDLFEIYRYFTLSDTPDRAEQLLRETEEGIFKTFSNNDCSGSESNPVNPANPVKKIMKISDVSSGVIF